MVVSVKCHLRLVRWEVFFLVKIGDMLKIRDIYYTFTHILPVLPSFLPFGKIMFMLFPILFLRGWQVCNNILTIQAEKPGVKFGFLYNKLWNGCIKSSTLPLKWYWNCWCGTLLTVSAVPSNVVQTHIRTSSCKFIKLKSGWILFFEKIEKN